MCPWSMETNSNSKSLGMEVELKSCGNPDYNQSPFRKLPNAESNMKVKVDSLKEAVKECMDFIQRNDLGGGNWIGGNVYDGRRLFAKISYNGRVWDAIDPSKEIIVK